jgi:hypothetical protein
VKPFHGANEYLAMTNKSFPWFPRVAAFLFGLALLGACDVAPLEPDDETLAAEAAEADPAVDANAPVTAESSALHSQGRACGRQTCSNRERCCNNRCIKLQPNQVFVCGRTPFDPPPPFDE